MSRATAGSDRPYSFDPAAALGWKNIGLDGLGCFLRSVEAVLLQRGYAADDVARGLAAPLDLVRRGEWYGPMSEFPACTAHWYLADIGEGHRQWPRVAELVTSGTPVVLMPDGHHWPGDDHEGKEHYHHHMVLAHRLDAEGLHLLDTDAPAEEGHRRVLPVGDALRNSCTRYAVLERIDPPGGRRPEEYAAALVRPSLVPLAEDIAELRAFHGEVWSGARLPLLLAKGMDVWVLGDVQPQLFLLGHALAGADDPRVAEVSRASLAAAARAQKAGLLLLGLHRFRSEGVYAVTHEELAALADACEELLTAMCRYADAARPVATGDGRRLERRLRGEAQWCFGEGRPLPGLSFG
ncbi:hypothetical protein CP973_28065 [Streptomyces albofaciens JCM 4342]|uniref:hypothetical protein n=1 Tax=Streptomyces albofaciens TaxID=66866 RepID=UPI00123A6CB1|nr:hypothetical protein [Streptomyces albofaciens]KAA6213148.1 hypothetical protein CP973_28065 [Streptomyces albofaciens JCM 4342]